MKINQYLVTASLCSALLISQTSHSDSNNTHDNFNQQRLGPPPAAFTACEGKSAGDSAQFETRRGKVLTGKCEVLGGKNAGKLVLRPNNLKRQGKMRKQIPEAAFKACQGKQAGDSAEFETRRGKLLSGTCQEINGQLALKPMRPRAVN